MEHIFLRSFEIRKVLLEYMSTLLLLDHLGDRSDGKFLLWRAG